MSDRSTIIRITAVTDVEGRYGPSFRWTVLEDNSGELWEVAPLVPAATEDEELEGLASRGGVEWQMLEGDWRRPAGMTAAQGALGWWDSVDDALRDLPTRPVVGDVFAVSADYREAGLWDEATVERMGDHPGTTEMGGPTDDDGQALRS
jgi:hypothetical protein